MSQDELLFQLKCANDEIELLRAERDRIKAIIARTRDELAVARDYQSSVIWCQGSRYEDAPRWSWASMRSATDEVDELLSELDP